MDVNIIAGEDSLINNDAYWDKGNKIFELDHILFEREVAVEENKNKITEHLEWFSGDVRIEKLPRKFESISSKQIRRNIDKGWDISDLIDPLAQSFVYERNMYKNEPQFKEIATVRSVQVGASNELNEDLIQEILNETPIQEERLRRIVDRWEPNGYGRILIMRDMEREGSITGLVYLGVSMQTKLKMF